MRRLLLILSVVIIVLSCFSCRSSGGGDETFEDPKYSVTLDCSEYPELAQSTKTIEVQWGQPYKFPVPYKENYVFDGWIDANSGKIIQSSGVWMYSSNMELKPKFSLRTYTVYCQRYPHFSDAYMNYTVESNDFYLPIPGYVDGYVFVGWSSGSSTPKKSVQIPKGSEGNKSYTAVWERVSNFSMYEIEEGPDEKELENYFIFEIVEDYAVLTGYYGEVGAEHLIIPREYKGCPVKVIGKEAFFGMGGRFTGLLSLPDTITTIESYAIEGCSGLPMNVLDENLQRIEGKALDEWIEQVSIGDNNGALSDLK